LMGIILISGMMLRMLIIVILAIAVATLR
jgi:hypothetical protein